MSTVLAPELVEVPRTSEYDYRVLYLSGTWLSSIGSEFRLRATVVVQRDGSAEGSIYWQCVRIAGTPRCYFGTETVAGNVSVHDVNLHGLQADPGLALDVYELALTGTDAAGTFAGRSRAYGDWCGRLHGTYRFQNRRN